MMRRGCSLRHEVHVHLMKFNRMRCCVRRGPHGAQGTAPTYHHEACLKGRFLVLIRSFSSRSSPSIYFEYLLPLLLLCCSPSCFIYCLDLSFPSSSSYLFIDDFINRNVDINSVFITQYREVAPGLLFW